MEPKLVSREAFTVMGVAVRGNPAKLDYNDIWMSQFMAREADIKPYSVDGAYYGAYFCTGQEGLVDMIAGMAVEGVSDAPEGLVMREVPAATYATFECTVGTIGPTWGTIERWLAEGEYEWDHSKSDFEYYPPETAGEASPVTIYVGVRRKATA